MNNGETTHPQVRVLRDGEPVEIDAGLVNLVRALWRRGYDTVGSCQHEAGTTVAWVAFATLADAERFVSEFGGSLFVPDAAEVAKQSQYPVGATAVVWPPVETKAMTRKVVAHDA